jgi:hypothetical protein
MIYTYEYKHPGESDDMWRESSCRAPLNGIMAVVSEWIIANAINDCIVEVRLVLLPNGN